MGKQDKKEQPLKTAIKRKATNVGSLIRKKKAAAKQERLLNKFAVSAAEAGAERRVKSERQAARVRVEGIDAAMCAEEFEEYRNRTKKQPIDPKKIARALMPNARF